MYEGQETYWELYATGGSWLTGRTSMTEVIDLSNYTVDNPYLLDIVYENTDYNKITSAVEFYFYYVRNTTSSNIYFKNLANTRYNRMCMYTGSDGIYFCIKCYDANGDYIGETQKRVVTDKSTKIRVTSFQTSTTTAKFNVYKQYLKPSFVEYSGSVSTKRLITTQYNKNANSKRSVVKRISSIADTKRNIRQVFKYIASAKRQINITTSKNAKVKRSVIKRVLQSAKTNREIKIDLYSVIENAFTKRQIIKVVSKMTSSKRQVIKPVLVKVNTKRVFNIVEKIKAESKRQINKDIALNIDSKRDIIKSYKAVINTTRQIEKNIISSFKKAPTVRNILVSYDSNITAKRDILKSVLYSFNTQRQIASIKVFSSINTCRNIVKNASSSINTNRYILVNELSIAPTGREIMTNNVCYVDTRRVIIKMFITNSTANTVKIVKEYDKNSDIELLNSSIVKNDKGQSNIQYTKVKNINGRIHPIKTNIEATPIGISDKTKYLLITKEMKLKADNYIRYNNVIYAIDILTKYTAHSEVYLKEL